MPDPPGSSTAHRRYSPQPRLRCPCRPSGCTARSAGRAPTRSARLPYRRRTLPGGRSPDRPSRASSTSYPFAYSSCTYDCCCSLLKKRLPSLPDYGDSIYVLAHLARAVRLVDLHAKAVKIHTRCQPSLILVEPIPRNLDDAGAEHARGQSLGAVDGADGPAVDRIDAYLHVGRRSRRLVMFEHEARSTACRVGIVEDVLEREIAGFAHVELDALGRRIIDDIPGPYGDRVETGLEVAIDLVLDCAALIGAGLALIVAAQVDHVLLVVVIDEQQLVTHTRAHGVDAAFIRQSHHEARVRRDDASIDERGVVEEDLDLWPVGIVGRIGGRPSHNNTLRITYRMLVGVVRIRGYPARLVAV